MAKTDNIPVEKGEQEALVATDTERLRTYWNLRNTILQQDRDIINLVKPKQKTDEKVWMTNAPKVFFDTARSLVSLYPPKFKLPIPMNYSPEQKDKMNKAERLCIGIYRSLENRVADSGGTSWLYELAYWVLGGWYAVFNICQKGQDGPEFIADIWDPINVYPEWDKDGLVRCVREYSVDQMTSDSMAQEFAKKLEFEYKRPVSGALYTVTNYWCREGRKIYNAILLNGGLVKPLTLQRNLRSIPVQVGSVGIPDKVSPDWQSRWGESIIAADRDVFEQKSAMRSLRAEIVSETAYPNLILTTLTGRPGIKGEDVKGHGSLIPLKIGEKLELLRHAATPQDALILDQEIDGDAQRGALPNVVYGGLQIELSGFAISQLMAAIKYKLGPYLNKLNYITGRVMSDLLYQYQTGNFSKVTLSTTNPYDMKRGMTYMEEYTKEDVPERIYVEAVIPITSQFDKTQSILNSVQALQAGLLSRETIWEDELGVDDSEQEKARIAEDQVSADPFIRQIEIIIRMQERIGVYEEAARNAESLEQKDQMLAIAEALRNYILMLEQGAGIIRQPQGTPTNPPGVPPQQRPVEMTPQSPDLKNAMTRTPPPSPNRPRKSVLMTPEGKWVG